MTHADEQAIQALLARYLDCWRRADLENWSDLFTEDSDFITWRGLWWRTRAENIAGHRAVSDFIRAQQSRYRFDSYQIHFLTETVALVHVRWAWPGLKEHEAAQPEDRAGILTKVLVRTKSGWRIRASQNTRAPIASGEQS